MKRRLIPFKLWPTAWALEGKSYLRAEAEYIYEGEKLERRLLEIDYEGEALADKLLDLDLKYHRKTTYEVDCLREKVTEDVTGIKLLELQLKHKIGEPYTIHRRLAELRHDNDEDRKLAILDVERAYERIDDSEYEKQKANVRNEPWVGIVDHGYNPDDGVGGLFIEFDWNDQWIAFLRANGYTGSSEDEIVERWFQDLNNTMAQEEMEFGYNFVQNAPRKSNRIDRGDGSADYL